MEEHTGYCDHCQRAVLIRRATVNHLLHAFLTCFTCFAWAIVWMWLPAGPWRCTACGMELPAHRAP